MAAGATTEQPNWPRLALSLGVAALAYALGFQPVLGAFRRMDAGTANRQALLRQLKDLEAKNQALAATLKSDESQLNVKAATVRKLSQKLRQVQQQEQTLSAQVQVNTAPAPSVNLPSVNAVPTVQTTTGASGRP